MVRRGRRGGRAAVGFALVVMATVTAGCAGDGTASAAPSEGPVVATFQTVGEERFRVLLTDPADIAIARRLVAGEDAPSIPNGRVIRGEAGVNDGYTWSIDPDDFEFADVTMEVCDGTPTDVETGVVTSERFCPWSAIIVTLDPAP